MKTENTLGGIFDDLYSTHKNNYNEFVFATQSSKIESFSDASILFHTNRLEKDKDNFASENRIDSYVTVNFLKHKVLLLDYQIKTRSYYDAYYPISWSLYALDEKLQWVEISNVVESGFNKINQVKTFSVDQTKNVLSRKFKLKLNGFNSKENNHIFVLNRVEFFGKLYKEKVICITQNKRSMPLASVVLGLTTNILTVL